MTVPWAGPARSLVGLRRRWTLAFVVGELVGFLPPAVTGATLAAVGVPDVVLVVGLTLAGLLEVSALSLAPNSWPGWTYAAIAVAAAVAMGLTVGGLTGHTLEQLLDSADVTNRPGSPI